MARVATTNLNLGMWLDGENPGAGSQSVDSTGLNGDKIKIDLALGTEHDPAGTHKADKIDGPSLKTTVADGSTLQASGTPRKLSVKSEGIQGTHLNANVVDNDSLEVSASTGVKTVRIKTIKAGKLLGSGTGKAVDGSTIQLNGSNELEVKDASVTGPKISHTNTRTKVVLAFGIDVSTAYGTVGTIVTSLTLGVPMRLPGCVTGVSAISAAGTVVSKALTYSVSSADHFNAGAKITVFNASGTIHWYINGTDGTDVLALGADAKLVTLDIEFD